MMTNSLRTPIGAALLVIALAGCTAAPGVKSTPAPSPPIAVLDQSTLNPAAQARADGGIRAYTTADVKFMQGMIHHHSQAILISKWAPSHGASAAVQRLCERIVVAQRDEIFLMQSWLRDRKLSVPPADTLGTKPGEHAMHDMPGMSASPTMMPGMLSPQQVAQLDSARGRQFDRLFLTYMIQHHEGAVTMVQALFASHGAAQDDIVYKLAADVEADQSAEIERMTLMLAAIPGGTGFFPSPQASPRDQGR